MITNAELSKVAKLIRVKLSDEEIGCLAEEISKILDFVEVLSEVNCDNIELDLGGTIESVYERDDVVTDGNIEDKILSNAPSKKYNMFCVPKIIE